MLIRSLSSVPSSYHHHHQYHHHQYYPHHPHHHHHYNCSIDITLQVTAVEGESIEPINVLSNKSINISNTTTINNDNYSKNKRGGETNTTNSSIINLKTAIIATPVIASNSDIASTTTTATAATTTTVTTNIATTTATNTNASATASAIKIYFSIRIDLSKLVPINRLILDGKCALPTNLIFITIDGNLYTIDTIYNLLYNKYALLTIVSNVHSWTNSNYFTYIDDDDDRNQEQQYHNNDNSSNSINYNDDDDDDEDGIESDGKSITAAVFTSTSTSAVITKKDISRTWDQMTKLKLKIMKEAKLNELEMVSYILFLIIIIIITCKCDDKMEFIVVSSMIRC